MTRNQRGITARWRSRALLARWLDTAEGVRPISGRVSSGCSCALALVADGSRHGFWYAFGQYDGYTLWEAPDNVKMASVALALSSRGAIKSQETVVLLTVEETIEALRGAAQVPYRRPGQSD